MMDRRKTMKKLLIVVLIGVAVAGMALAQSADWSIREVRDPVQLREKLNGDMGDIETRIAAVEATGVGGALASGKVIVGNAGGTGTAVTVTGDISLSNAGLADIKTNSVTSLDIADGAIVNADINASAAIVGTKLSSAVQTSLGKADSALQSNTTTLLTEGYLDVLDRTGTNWLAFVKAGLGSTNWIVEVQ